MALRRLRLFFDQRAHFPEVLTVFYFAGLQLVENHGIDMCAKFLGVDTLRCHIFSRDNSQVTEFVRCSGIYSYLPSREQVPYPKDSFITTEMVPPG